MTEEVIDIKSGRGGKVNLIFVSEGQNFFAGESLAVVVDTEQVHIIVTYVDPKDFKKIDIGTITNSEKEPTEQDEKLDMLSSNASRRDNVPIELEKYNIQIQQIC